MRLLATNKQQLQLTKRIIFKIKQNIKPKNNFFEGQQQFKNISKHLINNLTLIQLVNKTNNQFSIIINYIQERIRFKLQSFNIIKRKQQTKIITQKLTMSQFSNN
ncbi:hypothetical protein ABPG74_005162 [Tetrahymena malaccensis]